MTAIVGAAAVCVGALSASANDLIPTLEDAGYAFEATKACGDMQLDRPTTRRLRRAAQFRAGRRMFQTAAKEWGKDWTCQTARANLGPTVDLSDFDTGRLIIQPPPSEIPPLPTLKSSLARSNTAADAGD
ncbi:MAG: hypothetical protein AAGJ70_12830 [Pseudomonadota bacterium]